MVELPPENIIEEPKPEGTLGALRYALGKIGKAGREILLLSMADNLIRPIEAFRAEPKIMPHFHLPVQSGSDVVLRRMLRRFRGRSRCGTGTIATIFRSMERNGRMAYISVFPEFRTSSTRTTAFPSREDGLTDSSKSPAT